MVGKDLIAPCFGCDERTVEPNCHTTCTAYLEAARVRREAAEARKKSLQRDYGTCITSRRGRRGVCGLQKNRKKV